MTPYGLKKLDIDGSSDAVFSADGSLAVTFAGNGSGGGMHRLDTLFNSECMVSNSSSCTYNVVGSPPSIGITTIGGSITVGEASVTNVAYAAREVHSPCTAGVNEITEENRILISPNPTSNQFTIYDLQFTIENIEVYNFLGEKILSQQPVANSQKQISVDASTLSPGIYFLKVKEEKAESIAKFIKQ